MRRHLPRGVHPEPPGPGQESVWDYPRPPRLEANTRHLLVVLGGEVVAETRGGYRVLETSHPPVYYFPPEDCAPGALVPVDGSSFCEWKGQASYWSLQQPERITDVAWSYPAPTAAFAAIAGHLAFYAQKVEECWVDDEQVQPNPGSFYGGWITSRVVGPFKGGTGTQGW